MSLPWSVVICLSVVQLCNGIEPVEEPIRARKVPLLGDWSDISPESPGVQEAVQHAVTTFNTISRSKKLFKLIATPSVKSQVTNMINYKIEAILEKTKCPKANNPDLESCSLTKKRLLCHFEVTFNPRDDQHVLKRHGCKGYTEDIFIV